MAPFLYLLMGLWAYPFGGGGTFGGTDEGSSSTGATMFGAPGAVGSALGGADLIGEAAGAIVEGTLVDGAIVDERSCAGPTIGTADPTAGIALVPGTAGAVQTGAVAGAFWGGATWPSGANMAGRQFWASSKASKATIAAASASLASGAMRVR